MSVFANSTKKKTARQTFENSKLSINNAPMLTSQVENGCIVTNKQHERKIRLHAQAHAWEWRYFHSCKIFLMRKKLFCVLIFE